MNKSDAIDIVAKGAGITKVQAGAAIDALFAGIGKELKKGGDARFVGFGTWSVVKTKARTGRNPQTGKELKIPAGKRVKFSAGAVLKKSVK